MDSLAVSQHSLSIIRLCSLCVFSTMAEFRSLLVNGIFLKFIMEFRLNAAKMQQKKSYLKIVMYFSYVEVSAFGRICPYVQCYLRFSCMLCFMPIILSYNTLYTCC